MPDLSQLNFHHLRYFWEVARHGSLRQAAERLNVSQPTISAQIKALEESLGAVLFERAGRGLRLTSAGRTVMDFASEIFAVGTELLEAMDGTRPERMLRLHLGITDSLPKLVVWELLRPAALGIPLLHMVCSEGKCADLLGQMVAGRLDLILADEPAPSIMPVKLFSHLLGEAPVVFCASAAMARRLKKDFPQSLHGAPALLPASRTAWRHQLDRWFDHLRIHPRVVAEFDDAALMKTAASDGLGFAPVPTPVLDEATVRYDLRPLGEPAHCGFPCYLITQERSHQHPAVAKIAKDARSIFHRTATRSQRIRPKQSNP